MLVLLPVWGLVLWAEWVVVREAVVEFLVVREAVVFEGQSEEPWIVHRVLVEQLECHLNLHQRT